MRAHTQRILGAGRDYRQMLGVSSEAPKAEARRAYLTIQKYLNENGIKYNNLVKHREVTSSELAEAKEACQKQLELTAAGQGSDEAVRLGGQYPLLLKPRGGSDPEGAR